MATSGNIQSLISLLTDVDSLEIPDFQRNYSWEDSQIDDFHKDVMYSHKNGGSHFLGSTIFMKKSENPDDKTYQVIDGQQRFTTIFMYIAILRDLARELPSQDIPPTSASGITINVASKANNLLFSSDETGEARFKSNYLLKSFFYEHVIREPSPDRPSMPTRHKYFSLDLRKAYGRIRSLLTDELNKCESSDEKLRFLWGALKALQDRFQILKILTTTYPESFDVFMTLNNRGLALGPSDLVKSLFMKYMTAGLTGDAVVEANQNIAMEWKEATDNIDNGDPDQFLRHMLVATQSESVQAKQIFSRIDSLVKFTEGNEKAESRKLLTQIKDKSVIYANLLKPQSIDDSFIRNHCIALHQLLDSYRIFMLLVLDSSSSLTTPQRRELSKLCEILCIRWVLTGGNAQDLENHFQVVCNLFRSERFDYVAIREKLISNIPADARVRIFFETEITKTNLVRVVLHRINTLVGDNDRLINLDASKIHVEHVAPATPTDEWKLALFPGRPTAEVTPEYSAVVEQWGNKTILDKTINLSIKQKSFREKCDGSSAGEWQGYRSSPIAITRELVDVTEWTTALMRKRNRWICDAFLKIWSINSDEESVSSFAEWTEVNSSD
ncbi:MAG: DUF262 domain-containing HNH endonuclease family protein [Actinomycetota bacterium]